MRELGHGYELLELCSVGDGIASRLWHVRVTSDVWGHLSLPSTTSPVGQQSWKELV